MERRSAPESASDHVGTVVSGVENARVVHEPRVVQCSKHVAHVLVHRRHEIRVAGYRALDVALAREMRVEVDDVLVRVVLRMARSRRLRLALRHREILLPGSL